MALGCHPDVGELVQTGICGGPLLCNLRRSSICKEAERADSAVLNQHGFPGTIQHMNIPQCATRLNYDGLKSFHDNYWRLRYGKAISVPCRLALGASAPHTGLVRTAPTLAGWLGMRRRFARSTMYVVVEKDLGASCADTTMVTGWWC
jgi:hypothetical protein